MGVKGKTLRPWLYLVCGLLLEKKKLVIVATLWALFPRFGPWVDTPFGTFAVTVFGGLAAFVVVMLFSASRHDFLSLFEFQSIRQGLRYFPAGVGFALGLTGVWVTRIRMENFADNY